MSRSLIFLTSSFPRFPGDGAGRFVFDLGAALVARGHRVTQLAPQIGGRDEGGSEPDEAAFADGHMLRRFPWSAPPFARDLVYGRGIGPNLRERPWRLAGLPGLLRGFGNALDRALAEDPDALVVSHWALPAGIVAARRRRDEACRKHLSVVHGGGLQALGRRGARGLRARWLAGTDGVLCVSDDLRRLLVGARPGLDNLPPVRVAAMGIDGAAFSSPEDEAERTRFRSRLFGEDLGDRRVVIGVGRLIRLKGFDRLVAAAAGKEGVVVALAGEGPQGRALQEAAARTGVDLRLLGALPQAQLRQLYGAADLLAFPGRRGSQGRREGAPMVLAEALTASCPVLATSVGGVPERLAEAAGGLLVADDDEAFRRAFHRLIDEPAELAALRQAAREDDPRRFDRDRTARALEELWREVENRDDESAGSPA